MYWWLIKKSSEVLLYSIIVICLFIVISFKASEYLINDYKNYLDNQTTIIRIETEDTIYELNTLTIIEYNLDKLPIINYPEYVEE